MARGRQAWPGMVQDRQAWQGTARGRQAWQGMVQDRQAWQGTAQGQGSSVWDKGQVQDIPV